MILLDVQDPVVNPVGVQPNCKILKDGQDLVVDPRVVWFNTR